MSEIPADPPTAPWVRRAMPQPPAPIRYELKRGLAIALALVIAGAPAGVLWALTVPHLAVAKYGAPAYLIPNRTEDLASAGGDLVMIAILASLGIVSAVVALVTARRALVGSIVGLLVGGVGCGLIAMAVGHALVHGDYSAVFAHREDGTTFHIRPYVRGSADFLVLPLFAAFVFLVANLPALIRGRPVPGVQPVSSDAAAAVPGPAPAPPPSS